MVHLLSIFLSSQVSVVTWVSLRKLDGEKKIKSLKIFLNLDNYEQKGMEVEALWRTFSKTLLKSYNQELLPTRKDPSIFFRSYGLAIKRTRSLRKNRIKSILLLLLLSLLFQVPVSTHLVHATILVWSFSQPLNKSVRIRLSFPSVRILFEMVPRCLPTKDSILTLISLFFVLHFITMFYSQLESHNRIWALFDQVT